MENLLDVCPAQETQAPHIAGWIGEAFYARSMGFNEIAEEVRAWLPRDIATHIDEHWRGLTKCAGCIAYVEEMRGALLDGS